MTKKILMIEMQLCRDAYVVRKIIVMKNNCVSVKRA